MSQTSFDEGNNPRAAFSAVRRMLIAVSLFAVGSTAMAIWLYAHYIPMIDESRREIAGDRRQIEEQWDSLAVKDSELAAMCSKMASDEFRKEKDAVEAGKTLDKCLSYFPNDPALPAYKAEVFTRTYAESKKQVDFDYAIQAANQSIAIKPNEYAHEWMGLAYCLNSKIGPRDLASQSEQLAIQSLRVGFSLAPPRRISIQGMDEFQTYCSKAVRNGALIPALGK
jgi:tetratricopeptide (TPR) repeat protein